MSAPIRGRHILWRQEPLRHPSTLASKAEVRAFYWLLKSLPTDAQQRVLAIWPEGVRLAAPYEATVDDLAAAKRALQRASFNDGDRPHFQIPDPELSEMRNRLIAARFHMMPADLIHVALYEFDQICPTPHRSTRNGFTHLHALAIEGIRIGALRGQQELAV
jgi:hypothetical protein